MPEKHNFQRLGVSFDQFSHQSAMSTVATLNCPHCDQLMQYLPELAGQDSQCPVCHQVFKVPVIAQNVPQAITEPHGQIASGPHHQQFKPVPAEYAHLRKGATGVHNRKILWVCILGGLPFVLWFALVASGFFIGF